jgi:hypothetical protein
MPPTPPDRFLQLATLADLLDQLAAVNEKIGQSQADDDKLVTDREAEDQEIY